MSYSCSDLTADVEDYAIRRGGFKGGSLEDLGNHLCKMIDRDAASKTIHIVRVKTRFGDFVKAFSTSDKANAFYMAQLREWWDEHYMGEFPENDLPEAAAIYFESPRRDDDNDLEMDTIQIDDPA